jgi:hypothetical protein
MVEADDDDDDDVDDIEDADVDDACIMDDGLDFYAILLTSDDEVIFLLNVVRTLTSTLMPC